MQARLLNVTVQRTMVALRSDVEDKMHRLPLSYFDGRQRGELLSRVTNDIDNIQSSLSMTISQLLTSILTVVAVLAMMLSISPLLALITVLTVPLSLLATRAIARRSQRLFVAQWTSTGRLNAHIEETYSGFTVVKTFGHRAAAREQFRELQRRRLPGQLRRPVLLRPGGAGDDVHRQPRLRRGRRGRRPAGGHRADHARQHPGVHPIRPAVQPAAEPGGRDVQHPAIRGGQRRAGVRPARRARGAPAAGPRTDARPTARPSAGAAASSSQHVNFAYRPGTPVIEDLSLVAEPGSTVAIVGPTGAGKTTLVNLLMRFYDVDSGRILIDGVDITTMSRQSLRSRIGMVLQDTWLFDGTIAENIAYGRPEASEDEVIEAAKAAYVDRFVHTLPAGYQTRVSDDGGNISAGEKQLITIARAFLARPQLLILDEATSSVDTRTEVLIQHAMRELRRDRTSFIIAHRLSTIRDADRILVMEAGRIVEQGSHAELLARRGAYYAMTRA